MQESRRIRHRTLRRLVKVTAAIGLSVGCGSGTEPTWESLRPQYVMTHVNGVALPCFLGDPDPLHFKLLTGQLKFTLGPDHRWSGVWLLERWEGGPGPVCRSSRAPATDAGAGSYLVAAGDVINVASGSVMTLAADSVWMSQDEPTSCGLFGCLRTTIVRGRFQFTATFNEAGLQVADGVLAESERYHGPDP